MSVMSWIQKGVRFSDMVAVALSALELVGDVAKGKIGTKATSARELLDLIAKIVERVKAGFEGAVKPEDIRAEIAKLRADLKSNDDAVDAAVDEKFPAG